MQNIRNIAIIAHVDHGKTTMIDSMLKQGGAFKDHQSMSERVMDSNDLEKERGITILAKCTAIAYNGLKINIVDTPGHADFGGEVERILSMVDGVILLVDSAEGVMPQTKFVLRKAVEQGLKPIVVVNKIDRPDERAKEVLDEVLDLIIHLDASDEQLDFPVLYASGRDGWASTDRNVKKNDLSDLLETVVNYFPAPVDKYADGKFRFLATILESDKFLGKILTGRIQSGSVKVGDQVKVLDLQNNTIEKIKITKLQTFSGVSRVVVDSLNAGEICTIAGCVDGTVANTVCSLDVEECCPSKPIDPPTMSVTVTVNDSPFAGTEGKKLTSSMIKERLLREAETNVAIKIKESENKDSFEIAGRGELQIGVLIETMRREGFEMCVGRPKVLFKKDKSTDKILEPFEEVQIDVDAIYSGEIMNTLSPRKAQLLDVSNSGKDRVRMRLSMPTRSLIGYQGRFLTDTRGTGILSRSFDSYQPYVGDFPSRINGVLISTSGTGEAVAYALAKLEERGIMFVKPQDRVYDGMIVGEHNRDNDLSVNVLKGKQLTNVRSSGTDEAIRLIPPKTMTLEDMIAYIQNDEVVEVTPKSLRLRKKDLDETERKRNSRGSAAFEFADE